MKKKLMPSITFVCVLFFTIALSNVVHATQPEISDQLEIIPNQWVIVLNEAAFSETGLTLSNTITGSGRTVKELAESLIAEITQETEQNGLSLQSQGITNQLANVYASALKGFSATLTEEAAEALKSKPEVDYVVPDAVISLNAVQTPTPSWGLDRIDQRRLPLNNQYNYNTIRLNVHAYVLDTGIRASHQEFIGRVSNGADFIDNDSNPDDCHGHGTHVSGTLVGTTYGVAKEATLHAVRVLDCNGYGSYSGVIAGVDWVSTNHLKPSIANMSLGGGSYPPLDTAIKNSVDAGVVYVVAAGNNYGGNACDRSPAREPSAITVGSTDSNDYRSFYSDIGICLDLFAPGSNIKSAWIGSDTATNTISGTSMASPHVAGSAVVYLGNNPNASPADVTAHLLNEATTGAVFDAGEGSPNLLLYVAPDSVSTIRKLSNLNFCLNHHGYNLNDGGVINLWTCNGHQSQNWTLYDDLTIRLASAPNMCLNLHGNNLSNGEIINLWSCNGHQSQMWSQYDDGTIRHANVPFFCLNLHGDYITNGGVINLWSCNGHQSQNWDLSLVRNGVTFNHAPDGNWDENHTDYYMNYISWDGTLWSASISGDVFMHAPDGYWPASHADSYINYLTWDGSKWRAWFDGEKFTHAPAENLSQTHTDLIINYLTWDGSKWTAKKYLDESDHHTSTIRKSSNLNFCLNHHEYNLNDGGVINLWSCNGHQSQNWTIYDDLTIRMTDASDMCLNLHGNNLTNGGIINLWSCNGHQSQMWKQYDDGTIRHANNPNFCLNLHYDNITNGGVINLWSCNGHQSQNWTLESM